MSQKGLTPITIVILIAAVLLGYLVYSGKIALPQKQASQSPITTSNETASWQTYSNTKYGYELRYPSDWKTVKEQDLTSYINVTELNSKDYAFILEEPGGPFPQIKSGSKLRIRVEKNENFQNYGDYKNFIENKATGYSKNYKNKEEILIDGVKCLLLTGAVDIGGLQSYCFSFHNGIAFDFTFTSKNDRDALFKIFLSTFKFLDQNKTSDTSNQRIYTSKSNNYSFQYPTGYKLISEDNQTAVFGFSIGSEQPSPYLTITSKNLTDINSFKLCSQKPQNDTSAHCIALGSSWGQKNDVEIIVLGGRKAKSFYLGGGVDFAYHIVQTVDNPRLELKMYVAGGGLDKDFNQILSTFKFQQ